MADYRQIHVKMWGQDAWFLDLEPMEKLLFIYLFSNKYTSIAGIYELPKKVIAFETGLDIEFIESTLSSFSNAGKVFYENGIVWVVNLQKYNRNPSPKVQTRIRYDVEAIPNYPIKQRFIQYHNSIDTLSIPEIEMGTEQEHEQEIEQEQEKDTSGADAPNPEEPKEPKPQKRQKTKHAKLKEELVTHFCEITGLPPPATNTANQCKTAGSLWWGPLVEIAAACEKDIERTKKLMAWSVSSMDENKLTISSPKSIVKVALGEQARRKRDGNSSGDFGEEAPELATKPGYVITDEIEAEWIKRQQHKGHSGP